MAVTIALDAMGGDHGPVITVPGALAALRSQPDLNLVLVGQRAVLEKELARQGDAEGERLRIQDASQVVGMDEPPAQALRGKKDSSMRVGINLVKSGEAQAIVSAGNTGALMATARFVLKTLPGIDRPAIITAFPTVHGHVHILDLGANVDSSPEQLLQFGNMGSIVARDVYGAERPRVGLLNIGEADMKGHEVVQAAHTLLLEEMGLKPGDLVAYNAVARDATGHARQGAA